MKLSERTKEMEQMKQQKFTKIVDSVKLFIVLFKVSLT